MKLAGDEALARAASAARAIRGAGAQPLGGGGERQQVAWHSSTTTITNDASLNVLARPAATRVTGAAVELATIDDHAHVLVIAVVLHELRVKLISQWSWYDAVDHRGLDLTPRTRIRKRRYGIVTSRLRWLIPRWCAVFRGCGWSSRPRTQGEALAGGKGEPEDKGRRRPGVPAGGAAPWNQPSQAPVSTSAPESAAAALGARSSRASSASSVPCAVTWASTTGSLRSTS